MTHKHQNSTRKVATLTAVTALALIAFSCRSIAATTTASKSAATEEVMRTIHDYGRGHQGPASSGAFAKSDEDEDLYGARIGKIVAQEDFAQLERIAEKNRSERDRLVGGVWKNYAFYNHGVAKPVFGRTPTNADYARQKAKIKKWQAAYPESVTARLAEAYLYLNYADTSRGTELADKVSEAQWDAYGVGTEQAEAAVLEASKFKEKDPAWYYAMQEIGHNEGWDKEHFRELFEQAIAFEPGYYHYYRAYANYLLPQWYGEPGDLLAFAEEISERTPEPNGSMAYFWMVGSIACYCQEAMNELPKASYPKLKQGHSKVVKLFGESNLNANRFAFMAATFKDQASAHEAFAAIQAMEPQIWYNEQVFVGARNWADAAPQ
jgi:hypothetical protein